MNKTINNVVELTEKELECVTGGMGRLKLPEQKIEPDVFLLVPMRRAAQDRAKEALICR